MDGARQLNLLRIYRLETTAREPLIALCHTFLNFQISVLFVVCFYYDKLRALRFTLSVCDLRIQVKYSPINNDEETKGVAQLANYFFTEV
jgi:hypothetical protein